MSSPFQKNFSAKSPMSPLNGAYASGADAVFAVSDAPHFAKLQNDTLGGVLASDKKDPCQKLEERFSSGAISQERYEQGLKNCASKEEEKEKEIILPKPGTIEFDRNSMQANAFGGFGSNSTNERGVIS